MLHGTNLLAGASHPGHAPTALMRSVLGIFWGLFVCGTPLAGGGQKPADGLQFVPRPNSIVFGIRYSTDGKQIAFACEDRSVSIYDAATGKRQQQLTGHAQRVWSAAFSPDGSLLAACTGEYATPLEPGEVRVWELRTGKVKYVLKGHQGLVFDVCFAPDGQALLSGSWDGTIKVWDVAQGKEAATLKAHKGAVRALTFAPNGKIFASGGFDGNVIFWDAATRRAKKVMRAHAEGVQAVAFSPDNRYFATTGRPPPSVAPGEIKLWDTTDYTERARFGGFRGPVLSIAFSPDGASLAGGGGWLNAFAEVKLFELASGEERCELAQHREWVEAVAFSPNGRLLLSAGGFRRGVPGEILAHRLDGAGEKLPANPDEATRRRIWSTLGKRDAAEAYRVILTLCASPEAALAVLRDRLRPAQPADLKLVARLVGQLNSPQFKERAKAAEELRKLGDAAAPALRQVLARPPSEEVRVRVGELLDHLRLPVSDPELLRGLRCVEVLGKINSPAARQLLQSLATGAPESSLTQAAQAALARVRKESN